MRLVLNVYSHFGKGCLTNEEMLTQQCRKVLWVMVVLRLPVEHEGVSA